MNKESIDYTSEEFWATAPKDATHFYPENHEFHASFWEFSKSMQALQCWVIYPNKTIEHYKNPSFSQRVGSGIPRPTTFTKPVQEASVNNTEWDGTGVPPAGIDCEFQHRNAPNGIWHPTTIRYSSHAYIIYVDTICDEEACYRVNDGCAIDFRPTKKELTIQEKILDKWKAQALEFAYDTKDSEYPVGSMIDFIVNNYDVKEK